MATTYLSRTPSSAGNRTKWTWSAWVKRHELGNYHYLFNAYVDNNNRTSILTWDGDWFAVDDRSSGTSNNYLLTNRVLRDTNGWYHFVVTVDTSLSTADDRVKIYINGVQETSFLSRTNPPQNHTTHANNNILHVIGKAAGASYANVSMSHIHFIDGTAYDASAFGEYDANGVWKIKTSPSVTYGTNGFFILKDGNSVTDQSGNSNNWTVAGGTLTNTEDSPSNVFATLNPLAKVSTSTLSNGNTTEAKSNGIGGVVSTLAANSGKYYCEVKINAVGADPQIGIYAVGGSSKGYPTSYLGNSNDQAPSMGWLVNGSYAIGYNNTSTGNVGSAFDVGDIMMIALDMDNSKIWWGKNGTWFNSGDPANGTNAQFTNVNSDYHAFATGSNATNESGNYSFNFGNGYFGTTAVASAGTNASGIGIFEYDVPTGYTALSTKGLDL